jgi:CheY-like chemotaxis protein
MLPLADDRDGVGTKGEDRGSVIPKRRLSILVVDDNIDAAESLSLLFRLQGHDVHTVNSGLKVIETAERLKPHVAILDLGLPGITGLELARQLRRELCGKDMLLIALTGYGQEEDRRRTHDAGFDYHFTKPADPLAFQKVLADWETLTAKALSKIDREHAEC